MLMLMQMLVVFLHVPANAQVRHGHAISCSHNAIQMLVIAAFGTEEPHPGGISTIATQRSQA